MPSSPPSNYERARTLTEDLTALQRPRDVSEQSSAEKLALERAKEEAEKNGSLLGSNELYLVPLNDDNKPTSQIDLFPFIKEVLTEHSATIKTALGFSAISFVGAGVGVTFADGLNNPGSRWLEDAGHGLRAAEVTAIVVASLVVMAVVTLSYLAYQAKEKGLSDEISVLQGVLR